MRIDRLIAADGQRLRLIRLRALKDAPDAFATKWQDVQALEADKWEEQIQQLATFVAVIDEVDIGMVRGAFHDRLPKTGYLISMWVAPEARRRGVASAMIDRVVEWATSQALERLLLDVAEGNAAASALYARKGFVPNGVVSTMPPPREHIRELQMVKTL